MNDQNNLKFGDAMEKIKLYNEKLIFDEIKDKNKEFIEKYIEINNKILEYCYYFMPRMRDQHAQRKLFKVINYINELNERPLNLAASSLAKK